MLSASAIAMSASIFGTRLPPSTMDRYDGSRPTCSASRFWLNVLVARARRSASAISTG
jgi:hypothetical protein